MTCIAKLTSNDSVFMRCVPPPFLWRRGLGWGAEEIGMTQENDHKDVIFGIFYTIILVLTPPPQSLPTVKNGGRDFRACLV
jgi:hypothetical protein